MPDVVLDVDSVSKSFGSVRAVVDLSFEARSGEIIGLLGPNGAGKTTAVRVLSTILEPTAGTFSINGIPRTKPVEIRRQIGVLPESSGYPLHQTGGEFLRYYARLFGYPSSRARKVATALLSEVGLTDRATWPIATYSRGMRQRLGVARALVNDPTVIFLDEPTLGLDPAGQRRILRTIQDIAKERGATIILSTHYLDEVEETCSRVLILNHGRAIAQGTVEEIKRRCSPPRTARVEVPFEMHDEALAVLRQAQSVASVEPAASRRGRLTITLDESSAGTQRDGGGRMNRAIAALVNADIPILSLELEGGRLSDAFLFLTKEEAS